MYLTDELTNNALVNASKNGGEKMETKTSWKIYDDVKKYMLLDDKSFESKEWITVDDLADYLNEFKIETPLSVIMSDLHDKNILSSKAESTIKDDRECQTCNKKLSEHSAFSDSHTFKTETMDKDDYDAKAHVEMYP